MRKVSIGRYFKYQVPCDQQGAIFKASVSISRLIVKGAVMDERKD